jgi:hypothetical protein
MSARSAFRLAATGLFGIAMLVPPLAASLSATGGLVLIWASLTVNPDMALTARSSRLIVTGLAGLCLFLGLERGAIGFPEPAGATVAILVTVVSSMLVLIVVRPLTSGRLVMVLGVATFVVLSIEVMLTFGGNLYGLDVYRSHEAAADAIRSGQNPYTDAVVVADGSPNAAPGDVIEGYSYPPVTMVAYVAGDLIAGDPRWASVVAIFGVVGVMVALGRGSPGPVASVLVILIAVPLHRAIMWSGWTEPLSLALLTGGVVLWRQKVLSAFLLGLALASKQYLALLVPVLAMVDMRPWRRTAISVGVAALTLVPAALADFSSFWFTMVERPLSLGFRPDTRSVSGALAELGFDVAIPSWLMLVAVVLFSVAVARRVRTESDVAAAAAALLAVTFLLSMAFTNYWWLVQWTTAVSVVLSLRTSDGSIRVAA